MKLSVLAVLTLFLSIESSAKTLNRTVIAENINQGSTVDISKLPSKVVSDLLNKWNYGDEDCNLRFYVHDSMGNVRTIGFATVADSTAQAPTNWSSFNAVNASGQKFKIASYVNVSQLRSDSYVDLDTVCWE